MRIMTKVVTPENSPEELAEFMTQAREVANVFKNDEKLKHLLAKARAENMSNTEFLAAVMEQGFD